MAIAAEHKGHKPPARPRPELGELKARLAGILPKIAARAVETENARRVPDENIMALHDIGYFDIVKPALFGGYEHDFDVLIDLNIELAKACASTSWVAGIFGAQQWIIAGFPEQAQADVWGANPKALACGSYAPTAKAIRRDAGYILSGRWSFTSGCDNAQWALCAALLPPENEAGKLAPAFLLVPASDYAIDDTWHVVGLAGTGSKTLVLDNVFVPSHRVLNIADLASGTTPGAALHSHNPTFSVPAFCVISTCLASAAVGAAAGALEDYLARTSNRLTHGSITGSNNRMAEFPTVQLRVAEAAACTDAAREILLRDLRARIQTARAGGSVTVEDRITSRRGHAFAVTLSLRAVEALNASTGGAGLDLSNPVQRAWRDANAVARHKGMNWDAVGTMYGQMALGLTPQGGY
jgi:alkylation response protein AidB-like acyl-CoA dehydrogenase